MSILRTIFVLVVAYALAAMWSSHVSMDLAQTEWTSLWTYLWIAISVPVSMAVSVALFFGICGAFAWWVDR